MIPFYHKMKVMLFGHKAYRIIRNISKISSNLSYNFFKPSHYPLIKSGKIMIWKRYCNGYKLNPSYYNYKINFKKYTALALSLVHLCQIIFKKLKLNYGADISYTIATKYVLNIIDGFF